MMVKWKGVLLVVLVVLSAVLGIGGLRIADKVDEVVLPAVEDSERAPSTRFFLDEPPGGDGLAALDEPPAGPDLSGDLEIALQVLLEQVGDEPQYAWLVEQVDLYRSGQLQVQWASGQLFRAAAIDGTLIRIDSADLERDWPDNLAGKRAELGSLFVHELFHAYMMRVMGWAPSNTNSVDEEFVAHYAGFAAFDALAGGQWLNDASYQAWKRRGNTGLWAEVYQQYYCGKPQKARTVFWPPWEQGEEIPAGWPAGIPWDVVAAFGIAWGESGGDAPTGAESSPASSGVGAGSASVVVQ
jgi:hypothetical protein